jgi:aspartyl-tRNA(Asn)/glutamyl-tRNA(Gln) amidotransferase subunit C
VTAVATLARAEVDELATLARLALTEAEAERLRDELGAILAHVAALAEVDVDGVAPMTHAVPMDLAPRADLATASLPVAAALGGTTSARDDQFVVPAAIPGTDRD